jgi:hypothetical protein
MFCWEHVDILDPHRFEDVLLKVIVQTETTCPLDQLTSPAKNHQYRPPRIGACALPVDIDTIFPLLAWLIDKGLRDSVIVTAAEFVEATGLVVIVQSRIEEGIPEAS